MSLVVTVIAGPGGGKALPACVDAIAAATTLARPPDWLAPEMACDLFVDTANAADAEGAARRAIAGTAIDAVVQRAEGRRKRILVADMESTIIENEMLDELAEFVGLRTHVAGITRRAMNGELDFAQALAERVALLKDLPASVLDEAAARIRIMPGAAELVATMRAAGAVTALVSGGFTVFAEPVAGRLGFDRVVANRLDVSAGRIAGTVRAPIETSATKCETLLAIARESGVTPAEALAVGDGANDVPMLEMAGLGIAFRAKPAVVAVSRWHIDHADLTALLYAQGYRQQDIVGG